jgi:hypothetical protein
MEIYYNNNGKHKSYVWDNSKEYWHDKYAREDDRNYLLIKERLMKLEKIRNRIHEKNSNE